MHYQENPNLAIERFHLEFLRTLAGQIDPALFVVKGGCNLRLCLGSIRCSEDLDLDVRKIARTTLSGNVTKMFEARLPKILAPAGIFIQQFSAPKQTDTVQRWKATLQIGASSVSTKVEFSRRGFDAGVVRNLIHSQMTAVHQVPPFALPHYDVAAAVRQKASALAGRALTQGRDIFDLHYLFSQGGTGHLKEVPRDVLAKAAENALSISYRDYSGQVVAYLAREQRSAYHSKEVWDQMQEAVFSALEKAAEKPKGS
jgi:predicted nucleotidyltransferase component of viral defense system